MPTFLEFFAGGGMARAALTGWDCLFANDLDAKKAESYRRNWGGKELVVGDVAALTIADLPAAKPDLVWASFPCQDLSLAGKGAGMQAGRSGAFWPFWRLMQELAANGRKPRLIALENVCGLITSRGGRDFAALVETLAEGGYAVGAMVLDAQAFVPQSRPRLFVVAAQEDGGLTSPGPDASQHPAALTRAVDELSESSLSAWRWWRLPSVSPRRAALVDLIEASPQRCRLAFAGADAAAAEHDGAVASGAS